MQPTASPAYLLHCTRRVSERPGSWRVMSDVVLVSVRSLVGNENSQHTSACAAGAHVPRHDILPTLAGDFNVMLRLDYSPSEQVYYVRGLRSA